MLLAQGWRRFDLGATLAVVKQATDLSRLVVSFANTEKFRHTAFLIGLVLAAVLIGSHPEFTMSFWYVLLMTIVFVVIETVAQHILYDANEESMSDSFEGIEQIKRDLREMSKPPCLLLMSDMLVRFANKMAYFLYW